MKAVRKKKFNKMEKKKIRKREREKKVSVPWTVANRNNNKGN